MALNFPNSPTNGDYYTDGTGSRWQYQAATLSWTRVGPAAYTGTITVGTQQLTFSDGILLSVV